jgi:Predicted xylanase/chitin deacetylase
MKDTTKLLATALSVLFSLSVFAQTNNSTVWNHKKSAVCLTFDDGIDVDLDNAMPVLDSLGLKGTFYIPGNSVSISKRMDEWRALAAKGHELGNHTMFHACEGNRPGREWVSPDYDLTKYTMKRIVDEILVTNTLLHALDGKTQRTFAYACGDNKVQGSEFMTQMKDKFIAARGVQPQMYSISNVDLYGVGCYMINGETGDQLIDLVKKAMNSNSLVVFLFHGVGGGHNINVSMDAYRKLLVFLKQNEKDVWVAPFIDVMSYVREYNKVK